MSSPVNLKLLAIDDDPHNLEMIRLALDRQGLEILTEQDPERGFELFLQSRPKVVLLDLVMPKVTGIELLERIVGIDPGVEVILVTAHYSAESAVEAIQKGATDYLTKPIEIDKLRARVSALMADAEARQKTLQLDQALIDAYQFEGLVGRSPLMLEVYAKIRRIAPHFRTVLVTGATGTGKELVARALHRLSPVGSGPFVVCNCSALVDSLVESELFGYVKGAFTGATQDKVGLFEHADKGTIFLDEIGELAPAAQAKLLRVLQNRQVQRVGSLTPRNIDVRVIAATHRNLKNMVRDGQFREDLYYRLAVVEIPLPILANRREDLPLLERYFIERFANEYNKPIAGLVRRAQTRLATYPWPGNVRELENAISSAAITSTADLLDLEDLPKHIQSGPVHMSANSDSWRPVTLEEVERVHVQRVLDLCEGNQVRAAEMLGIGRTSLYRHLKRTATSAAKNLAPAATAGYKEI